jgi:hypothetical protein
MTRCQERTGNTTTHLMHPLRSLLNRNQKPFRGPVGLKMFRSDTPPSLSLALSFVSLILWLSLNHHLMISSICSEKSLKLIRAF